MQSAAEGDRTVAFELAFPIDHTSVRRAPRRATRARIRDSSTGYWDGWSARHDGTDRLGTLQGTASRPGLGRQGAAHCEGLNGGFHARRCFGLCGSASLDCNPPTPARSGRRATGGHERVRSLDERGPSRHANTGLSDLAGPGTEPPADALLWRVQGRHHEGRLLRRRRRHRSSALRRQRWRERPSRR
jgi:hypothetical protein